MSEVANALATSNLQSSQFINSMKFIPKTEFIEIPKQMLFQLIANQDIDGIRKEIHLRGPAALFQRDDEFRGLFHFAVGLKHTLAHKMIDSLFNSFFDLSLTKFIHDISELEFEKHCCIEASVAAISVSDPGKGRKGGKINPANPISKWFAKECKRALIRAAIRNEWFWGQVMQMKDLDGRTILHYAIASNGTLQTLDSIVQATQNAMTQLLNAFPKTIEITDADIIESGIMYDSISGHQIVAAVSKELEDLIPVSDLTLSSKKGNMDTESESKQDDADLKQSVGKKSKATVVKLDYDIIIPWLLKNINLQCQNKGQKFELSAVSILAESIEDYNKSILNMVMEEDERTNAPSKSSASRKSNQYSSRDGSKYEDCCRNITLLVPELKQIFELFDIRIVEEVIQELCRRYLAEEEDILLRFELINNYREKVWENEQAAYAKSKRKSLGLDSKESKGAKGSSGSKSTGDRDGADSKNSGDYYINDYADGNVPLTDSPVLLSENEKMYALNVRKLLEDIRSGQAFVAVSLDEGNSTQLSRSGTSEVTTTAHGNEESAAFIGHKVGSQILLQIATSRSKTSNEYVRFSPFPFTISRSVLDDMQYQALNAQDKFDRTPLMIATALGYKDHVVKLLNYKYKPYAFEYGGKSSKGTGQVVDLSIMAEGGQTAISLATNHSINALLQQRLVGWLTEQGTSEQPIVAGQTSLSDMNKSRAIMQLTSQLEQLKSNNWQYSRFPLSWAVVNCLPEAVHHLLNTATSSTNINEADAMGRTAMHECMTLCGPAAPHSNQTTAALQIAEALYTAGADVNAQSSCGKSPLHELFCANANAKTDVIPNDEFEICVGRRNMLRAMLQWGADPIITDFHGKSGGWAVIHYCARNDVYLNCMLEFLRYVDVLSSAEIPVVYAATKLKQNCLHIACAHGCPKIAHVLSRWDVDAELICRLYGTTNPGQFSDYDCKTAPSSFNSKYFTLASTRDVSNKLPKHLVTHSMSSSALDTLSLACYVGDSVKTNDILRSYVQASGKGGYKDEFWLDNSVNCKSPHLKLSPLHFAIIGWAVHEAYNCGNLAAAKLLRINLASNKSKSRAISTSKDKISSRHAEVVQLLLSNFAYTDSVDRHGRTPLMIAAGANLNVAITMLLGLNDKSHSKKVEMVKDLAPIATVPEISPNDDTDAIVANDNTTYSRVYESIVLTDSEGNNSLHFAYGTGAASCMMLLENVLRTSCNKESLPECLNFNGESPLDNAGKITLMLPVIPKKPVFRPNLNSSTQEIANLIVDA